MSEELPRCEDCGGVMHGDYVNNGYELPNGVPHWDIEGYYCPVCDDPANQEDYDELI